MTKAYTFALRATGLNPTKFTLLQVLDERGRSTQGTLADALAIDTATLTRSLGALARRGWIRSERGEDRRERYWEITTLGLRRLVSASHRWLRTQQILRALLGERWNRLFADLDATTSAALRALEALNATR